MKKKVLRLSLVLLAGVLLLPACAAATDGEFSFEEQWLLERINEVRENPRAAAARLGIDLEPLFREDPGLETLFEAGFGPLVREGRLDEAARAGNGNMLVDDVYAPGGEGGVSPAERAETAGYLAFRIGETVGLVSFSNYMDPGQAVTILFEKIVRDEFDPGRTAERYVLSPDFDDIGLAFGGGILVMDGLSSNVYVATCTFGSGPSRAYLELLYRINQARAQPLAMAERLGKSGESLFRAYPDREYFLRYGLPPLTLDGRLVRSAQGHVRDMFDRIYFGSVTPDGLFPEDRAAGEGYPVAAVRETLGRWYREEPAIPEGELLQRFFRAWFFRDMERLDQKERLDMMNERTRHAGFGILSGYFGTDDSAYDLCRGDVTMAVADYGIPIPDSRRTYITGLVFHDADGDGLYGWGEGLEGMAVTVQGQDGTKVPLKTDSAGGFSCEAGPGIYSVTVDVSGEIHFRCFDVKTQNRILFFPLTAEDEGF